MADYRDVAYQMLEKGYTVIPVGADKQPTINWTKVQKRHITENEIESYFHNCYGVALLTGGLNRLEAIDFDLKYDLTKGLMDRIKEAIPVELLSKMFVQKTRNGGYHWIYKCEKIEQNQKLATRETTVYEKHVSYMDAFNNSSSRDKAWKIIGNDKSRVLIETRGGTKEGDELVSKGYVLITPTPGYEYVYGSINEITVEERDFLISTMREFNEYFPEKVNYKLAKFYREGDNPFTNFNENGDVLAVLYENGWEEVTSNRYNVRLRRPGNPDSKSSALFDMNKRVFNVFSTSCDFENGKGYSPVDVFLELECNGDLNLCFKKLKELGY
jgi:hypothetical protein